MREQIIEELKELIVKTARTSIDKESIGENTNLVYDLGFDSMGFIGLIVELEKKFDIEFNDESITAEIIGSFQKLVDIIVKKQEAMQTC